VNHSDFKDWQSYPITKAFFISVNNRIEALKEELSYQAGESSTIDSKKVGAIQALRDVLDTDWFEETSV
jgi:hypothetical protein